MSDDRCTELCTSGRSTMEVLYLHKVLLKETQHNMPTVALTTEGMIWDWTQELLWLGGRVASPGQAQVQGRNTH